ncbi:MAG: PhoH family protein [Candidatus Competibacterales bacterium]|nr:PhoH family protein [Candidatus Competibacterales bacterium]
MVEVAESDRHAQELLLEPADNERLANLCGPFDRHLRQIEESLGVEIANRSNQFRVSGARGAVGTATSVLETLYRATRDESLAPARIHLFLQQAGNTDDDQDRTPPETITIRTRRGQIRGRGPTQQRYLHDILTHDITFGVGPAGTGKTYLAVACAVEALEREQVRRLVLVRPAVEAGERLGFLPGDLVQKVDPYLRPLYDALYEMLGFERVGKLLERGVIEIAPLAFMRGRTLNESFIILDEAQNTTAEQMKMFLTRLGFGSTAVITGDLTQIDLPRHQPSGLKQTLGVLEQVEGISITRFGARDVVRHPLVQRIVDAYDRYEQGAEAQGE